MAIVGAMSDLGLTAVGVRELSMRPPAERWSARARSARIADHAHAPRQRRDRRDRLGLVYSPTLAAGVALACVGLLLQATQDNFSLPLLVGLRLGTVSALELSRQLLIDPVHDTAGVRGRRTGPVPGRVDSRRRDRARRDRDARSRHTLADADVQPHSLAQVRQADAPLLGRGRRLLDLPARVDHPRLGARHRRPAGVLQPVVSDRRSAHPDSGAAGRIGAADLRPYRPR